jgi:ribonuclease-3
LSSSILSPLLPTRKSIKIRNTLLKKILGFRPRNRQLYEIALIHKSASIQLADGSIVNNERLEYLGDAILDAVVSDLLYTRFPEKNEGSLTKMRSQIVRRDQLNDLAVKLGISELIISNTEYNKMVKNIPGNTFEALLGAIYLDRGFDQTKKFIVLKILHPHIDLDGLENGNTDYKSQLLEWMQKTKEDIRFEHQQDMNEDSLPVFFTRISLQDKIIGTGSALSKKESEQIAAEEALRSISQES